MQGGIAELEQRRAGLLGKAARQNEQRKAELDSLLNQIRSLSAETECGALSMEEYERLSACKAELEQKNTEYVAAMQTVNAKGQDFDAKLKEIEEKIQAKKALISAAAQYVAKRSELLFASLKMNRVEISLYDVVKTTGEVNRTWRHQVEDGHAFTSLAVSVNASNALLDSHRIPRQVIIDHAVAKLVV